MQSKKQEVKHDLLLFRLHFLFWETDELKTVIASCMGLYLEVVADDPTTTPGETLNISIEVTNRSDAPAVLTGLSLSAVGIDTAFELTLDNNIEHKLFKSAVIPQEMTLTNPYWLNESGTNGMYRVDSRALIGKPETERPIMATFRLIIHGEEIVYQQPVIHKYEDPAKGEVRQPFEITPPVFVNFREDVYLFPNGNSRTIPVIVRAGQNSLNGVVRLQHPEGWQIQPDAIEFELSKEGEEQVLEFEVTPGQQTGTFRLTPVAEIDGRSYNRSLTLIEYDHIPTQTVMMPAEIRATNVDLQSRGERIGYVMGSGDAIPAGLELYG